MINIRKVEERDLQEITDLEARCFSRPWSEKSFRFELENKDALFLMAEEEGALAGFFVMHRFCDDGELFNIAVREDKRQRGIGGELLKEMFAGAKKMGVKRIYLEVRKSNLTAQSLYKKHGFAVCGVRKNYYDDPKEDAVLMDAEIL